MLHAKHLQVEGLYSQRCLEIWQGVAEGASGQVQAQQQSRQ